MLTAPQDLTRAPWFTGHRADPDLAVYELRLDADARPSAHLTAILTDDERRRAARFHFEKDRDRFVAGRFLVRSALAAILDRTPRAVPLFISQEGRPEVEGGGAFFNISHAGDRVVLAVSTRSPVGIDVEAIVEPHPAEIAELVFDPNELDAYSAAPPPRAHFFYKLWTRKEAAIKALGHGLLRDPRQISILGDIVQVPNVQTKPTRIVLETYPFDGNYAYAIAVVAAAT
jgi:4'-phosphopantetheinyl transferase